MFVICVGKILQDRDLLPTLPDVRRPIVAVVVVLVYIIRLFYLQVIDQSTKNQADNNALVKQTIYPSRGLIYDRNGELLVFNQPIYEQWLSEAVAIGRIDAPGFFDDPAIRQAWCGCLWMGASMGHVDPLKEVNAAATRIAKPSLSQSFLIRGRR